jgi:predicted enzyme related to lactoylglutathione lyase
MAVTVNVQVSARNVIAPDGARKTSASDASGGDAMSNPCNWFEIYVDDMSRAKAFYGKLFGVELTRLDNPKIEMFAFPSDQKSYGTSGALVRMPGFDAGANSTLVYFACADCSVEAAKAVELGGRLQKEKQSIGQYGFIALVFDTEGNMIGLHSMK